METANTTAAKQAGTEESINLTGNRLLRDLRRLLQVGDGLLMTGVQEQLAEQPQLSIRAEDGKKFRCRSTHIVSVSTNYVSALTWPSPLSRWSEC